MPDQVLRDARGNIQGFIRTSRDGSVVVSDSRGHHTGYIWGGKTRDLKMNILAHEPRLDLISPVHHSQRR